jgi:hypothetical protein
MGSYEKWSEHVRAPLVWAGFADPAKAIELMRESVSSGDQNAFQVLVGLKHVAEINLSAKTWRAQRMHKQLYARQRPEDGGGYQLASEQAEDLRAALEELRPPGATGPLDSRALGKLLSSIRSRVIGGLKLESKHDKKLKVDFWSVTGRVTVPEDSEPEPEDAPEDGRG